MKFEQLKQTLKNGVEPIYLIEGEEAFFRNRASEMIKEVSLSEPSLNYASYTGADLKTQGADVLVMALRSCPFMSDKRVTEVFEWYPSAADLKSKTIKEYFAEPSDTSVLMIVNEKPCEALKKAPSVTLVDCARASEELLVKYIRSKTNKNQLIISTSVCEKLINYCQFDLVRIDKETDKLIDFCRDRAEITDDAVEKLVAKDNDYKIYEIVDFIAGKRYTEAYKIISETRTPSDKQMLLVSLYSYFRRMFYCVTSKEDNAAVAEKLGVKEYAVKMSRKQASSFTPKRLKLVMDKLADGDAAFKTGVKPIDNVFNECVFGILTE